MKRRAIVFVPGFSKREQNIARDDLVQSLLHYTDGWDTAIEDTKTDDGKNVVSVSAKARKGVAAYNLDVFEAYWGDLIPDWTNESPMARFQRGTSLIVYWALGGMFKSLLRREFPPKTMIAMAFAGAVLVLWYAIIFLVLMKALLDGDDKLPAILSSFTDLIGVTEQIQDWAKTITAWPISLFLISLLGLGWLESVVNVSAFTKAYLRDDVIGDGIVGLRAKSRKRVIEVLDHVYAQTGDKAYDEVYVLAHSLGGGIAIDAVAEYGDRLKNTTLITWGTALGALVQQEPLIEAEIRKFYTSDTKLQNWIDVVFRSDYMGSKAPVPLRNKRESGQSRHMDVTFPKSLEPPVPHGHMPFSSIIHEGYYRCEDAVLLLVQPAEDLPRAEANRIA